MRSMPSPRRPLPARLAPAACLMLDIMYQIPSLPELKELVISREVVDRRVPPLPIVRKVS